MNSVMRECCYNFLIVVLISVIIHLIHTGNFVQYTTMQIIVQIILTFLSLCMTLILIGTIGILIASAFETPEHKIKKG